MFDRNIKDLQTYSATTNLRTAKSSRLFTETDVKISDHSEFNGMISKDFTHTMIQNQNEYAMLVSGKMGGSRHHIGSGQERLYQTSGPGFDSFMTNDKSPVKGSSFDPLKTRGTEKSWSTTKLKTFIRKKDERMNFVERKRLDQNGIPEPLVKKDFVSKFDNTVSQRKACEKSRPVLEDELGDLNNPKKYDKPNFWVRGNEICDNVP